MSTYHARSVVSGTREDSITNVSFTIEYGKGVDDMLTITIEPGNAVEPTTLKIRGEWERAELPGHLRWLANVISRT